VADHLLRDYQAGGRRGAPQFPFAGPDILYAAEVCNPTVFILGSEFLSVTQPVQKDLKTVKTYICVGDTVPADMIDYKTIAASTDTSEAMVDVDDRHDLAMMFTSGTTGKPKAVLHTHYSINNTAIGNGMSYFVEKNDNYVFFLPLYHSGTMFLWAPFYATGATGPSSGVHGAQVDPRGFVRGKGDGYPLCRSHCGGHAQCLEERPESSFPTTTSLRGNILRSGPSPCLSR
jgi:acyl-CoA synthetase (AMP-forming)/AMP-acid ligase II